MERLAIALVAVVGASVVALSCGRSDPLRQGAKKPKNLILIVVDTLRADVLGFNGGKAHTPNLDRLALEGVVFERAYSPVPVTGPSHASLLTGLLPFEHGVTINTQPLPDELETLAESLSGIGYTTAAVVSLGVLRSAYGFSQGFEFYDDRFEAQWFRSAEEISRSASTLIDSAPVGRGDAPYFLWVHWSDPHEPYAPPNESFPVLRLVLDGKEVGTGKADGNRRTISLQLSPGAHEFRFESVDESSAKLRFRGLQSKWSGVRLESKDVEPSKSSEVVFESRLPFVLSIINGDRESREIVLPIFVSELAPVSRVRHLYEREVEYVDQQVGLFLDNLNSRGLLDETLVVFTSDHGEALGEHGHIGHIDQLYESSIRVPLIFWMPGRLPGGVRLEETASLVDIAPTTAELLGFAPRVAWSGRDLFRKRNEQPILSATFKPLARNELRGLTFEGFRFIRDEEDHSIELYSLDADPLEVNDLARSQPERAARMDDVLNRQLSTFGAMPRLESAPLSKEDEAKLRALGYLR